MNYKVEIEKLLEAFEPQSNAGVNTYFMVLYSHHNEGMTDWVIQGENFKDAIFSSIRKAYVNGDHIFYLDFKNPEAIKEKALYEPHFEIFNEYDQLDYTKTMKYMYHFLIEEHDEIIVIEIPKTYDPVYIGSNDIANLIR